MASKGTPLEEAAGEGASRGPRTKKIRPGRALEERRKKLQRAMDRKPGVKVVGSSSWTRSSLSKHLPASIQIRRGCPWVTSPLLKACQEERPRRSSPDSPRFGESGPGGHFHAQPLGVFNFDLPRRLLLLSVVQAYLCADVEGIVLLAVRL